MFGGFRGMFLRSTRRYTVVGTPVRGCSRGGDRSGCVTHHTLVPYVAQTVLAFAELCSVLSALGWEAVSMSTGKFRKTRAQPYKV